MRVFEDERGYNVTETELLSYYCNESALSQEMTFEQYIRECCGKNGTLTEITK